MPDLRDRFRTLDALDVPDVMARAVLIGAKPPSPDLEPPRRGRASAVVVGVIVGVAAIVFVMRAFQPSAPAPAVQFPSPSIPPAPRLVMPVPAGSEPGMPLTGNLVLQVQAYTGRGTNMWLVLNEDGRLITNQSEYDEWHDMRWSERRLTPAGLDLVRSRIEEIGSEQIGTRGGLPHFFRVRGKLADPATWLPASAWQQAEAHPFVPRGYVMILGDLDRKHEDAAWLEQRPRIHELALPPGIDLASAPKCSLLTLAQTQELVAALDAVDTRFSWDEYIGIDGSGPGVGMTWALRRTDGDPFYAQLLLPLPHESCGHLDGR
jgi:hypothetical protein